jgi:hypothetical protein
MSRKSAKTTTVAQPQAVAPHRDANAANAFSDFLLGVTLWLFAGGLTWYFELPLNFDVTDREFNPLTLVPVVLGVIGAYQLVRAGLRTWRSRKFGASTLEVGPARRGQKLAGTVRTPTDLAPTGDYTVILKCIRTTQRGSDQRAHHVDELMWEDKWIVKRDAVRSSAGIPFQFMIPSNLPVSRGAPVQSTSDGDVRWVLTANAPMPGLDYYAPFAITVR